MRIASITRLNVLKGVAVALALVAAPSVASASDIAGSWTGTGSIMMPSGARESARCNVSYSKASSSAYTAFATCATKSARVTQSARLHRVGGNAYEGSFHNSEYNVSGSMSVTVSGSSQSVYLSGGGGQAQFKLSRR